MSASAVDRRRARSVELAMEIIALETEEAELDRRENEMRGRVWQFVNALARCLQSALAGVPGGRRAWALFAGIVDALKGEDAIERLDDERRDRELAAARELAGLLDGTAEVKA
jgi:hypothetical protein